MECCRIGASPAAASYRRATPGGAVFGNVSKHDIGEGISSSPAVQFARSDAVVRLHQDERHSSDLSPSVSSTEETD